MDILKEGLSNWTSLLPLVVAAAILVRAWWLMNSTSGWGAIKSRVSVSDRIIRLSFLRKFIPLLPLTGVFGTVWALVKTLSFMAEQSRKMNIADALPDVLAKFSPALLSTAVGVIGAVVCIVVVEFGLHSLGEDETN